MLRRLGRGLSAQAADVSLPGPLIKLSVIINSPVLHHVPGGAERVQNTLGNPVGQEIPLLNRSRGLSAPVVEQPPHNMPPGLLPRIPLRPQSRLIRFPLLRRHPDSRFQVAGQAASRQVVQPFGGHLQLSGGQISFHHQQGVELLLIFRQLPAFPFFG